MAEIISCVYQMSSISNPQKFYIGSAVDLIQRKRHHLSELKRNTHCNPMLQNHYNKYGKNDFVFNILARCNREELKPINGVICIEQFYILAYKPSFNICPTAGSPFGIKQSEETCKKRSKSMMGKPAWNKGKTGIHSGNCIILLFDLVSQI